MDLQTEISLNQKAIIFREIENETAEELGRLLYEADRGTVDDKGLPVENSIEEIQLTLSGKYGPFLKNCSLMIIHEGQIISAALFTLPEKEAKPLLAFTMTHPEYKNLGYCQALLKICSSRLKRAGYDECFLSVNSENLPAIAAYKKVGFKERS